MANDRRQIELERNFRNRDYQYLRKRQTKSEARRRAGVRHRFMIKKDELAQAVAACDFDPSIVREGKEQLFEKRFYGQVFPNADPRHYLPRYWLVSFVSAAARGYPERAYAKWLVTHFAWRAMARVLDTRNAREIFIRASERRSLDAPRRLCQVAFRATLKFYHERRGSGERAIDVSTFFKRKGLHLEFARFWSRIGGKYKLQFSKALSRFKDEIRQRANEA